MYVIIDYSDLINVKVIRDINNKTKRFETFEDAKKYVSDNINHECYEIMPIG